MVEFTFDDFVCPGSRMTHEQRKEIIAAIIFAALVPVVYVLITDHIWEDYFITFRHSRNLTLGHGLVFQPGERVHGFTSPLGVLVPAAFDRLFAVESYGPALNAFRGVSILAFAGGVGLGLRAMQLVGAPGAARFMFVLLYSTEAKAVGFAVNGMETAFILFFLSGCVYVFCAGWTAHWRLAGMMFAGLMWTRPDSFIYIAAIGAGSWMFSGEPRRHVLIAILRAAAVCTVCYLPWFVWAWWYYGSPVPHTIVAKAPDSWGLHLGQTLSQLPAILLDRTVSILKPVYAQQSYCWPGWLDVPALLLGVFAFFYWLIPSKDRLGRMASFCFAMSIFYFALQRLTYPWYFPPAGLLAFISIATGPSSLAARLRPRFPILRFVPMVLWTILGLTNVFLLGVVTRQTAIAQRVIEFEHRMQIGLWLKDQVQPGENVYLECLGYIGYFSNAKFDDWPGLVSPRIVGLRRQGFNFATIVPELKPEWIVVRRHELEQLASLPGLDRSFQVVRAFDAMPALEEAKDVMGIPCLAYDAQFIVLRSRASASQRAP